MECVGPLRRCKVVCLWKLEPHQRTATIKLRRVLNKRAGEEKLLVQTLSLNIIPMLPKRISTEFKHLRQRFNVQLQILGNLHPSIRKSINEQNRLRQEAEVETSSSWQKLHQAEAEKKKLQLKVKKTSSELEAEGLPHDRLKKLHVKHQLSWAERL